MHEDKVTQQTFFFYPITRSSHSKPYNHSLIQPWVDVQKRNSPPQRTKVTWEVSLLFSVDNSQPLLVWYPSNRNWSITAVWIHWNKLSRFSEFHQINSLFFSIPLKRGWMVMMIQQDDSIQREPLLFFRIQSEDWFPKKKMNPLVPHWVFNLCFI